MNNTFCPIPWNTLSILPDGRLRLCCFSSKDNLIKNPDENSVNINNIKDLSDLVENPMYMDIRNRFLKNEGVPACAGCIKNESNGIYSHRNELGKIFQIQSYNTFKLEFLDISFSNLCNMQCPMCSSSFSSKWARANDEQNIINSLSSNLWDTPFFKNQLKNIKMVLLQGGEPFLAKEHLPFLDKLIDIGRSQEITLDYITNLSIPLDEKTFSKWTQFKSVNLYISLEGTEKIYEFTRPPIKWARFKSNLENILKQSKKFDFNFSLNFKTVVQIYNIEDIVNIIDFTHSLESKIIPEFSLLEEPKHLRVQQLPKELLNNYIEDILLKLNQIEDGSYSKDRNYVAEAKKLFSNILNLESDKLSTNFWPVTKYFNIKYKMNFQEIISEKLFKNLKENKS